MFSTSSYSRTLPSYRPTNFTCEGLISGFYEEDSRELQKVDRSLELASRAVLCHHFGIYYDPVLWHDGRCWVASDYWLRPSSDKAYEMCFFAPTKTLAIQHTNLFGKRLTPDFGRLLEDSRSTSEKREAYREIQDELGGFVEKHWQAIKHEAEIVFRHNVLSGFAERLETEGIKFGGGIEASPTPE